MKYTDEFTKEIVFPLGGIGTGSIGLSGNGGLVDWEIFNRPSKGSINGYSHFAVRAIKDGKITAAVINSDIRKDLMGQYEKLTFKGYGFGPDHCKMVGFPHFKNMEFDGEFPIAVLNFSDIQFPAEVKMTAFNPFIPNDAKNSSIPAGFFDIEVSNTTDDEIKYQIALSVMNPFDCSKNVFDTDGNISYIKLENSGDGKDSVKYGDLTIATDCQKTYSQTYWYRGSWRDGIVSFWNDFSQKLDIKDRVYDETGARDTATLIAEIDVKPHEKKNVRFIISWNIPNNYNYWSEYKDEDGKDITWKNYYATVFENSVESAKYSLKSWDSLYSRTAEFKNTLFNSTLPREVIEAASANLSVLKSPTVLRLEDGTFYGWEGVHELRGSCEGTCGHVWNYAYALCFLFPELERSIRDMEFKYSTDEDGKMCFRTQLPLGRRMDDFRACVDGHMGSVIKTYREWKLSGNNEWLREKWDSIKLVLEYAWSDKNPDAWDRDCDGILEGRQHHTLDMEMFGPSSWLEGMYLAALKAAAEMGEFLGDTEKAYEYKALYEKAVKWTKDNLFNGKYFIQKIDITDKSVLDKYGADNYWNDEEKQIKYQIAEGSSIDQMLAQWHADIVGLGEIFDAEQVNSALGEMMKNNYKPNMRYITNPWRIFSINDEAGSVICVYPDGTEKPKIPIPYCEETMTGFEYSFAGLLCSRGKIEDGLKVVRAVRDRFDGKKRNPWNEFECGSNYARSMASFSLIPILSGFEFDMPNHHIGFNPYLSGDFNCIWSLDGAWGDFRISDSEVKITLKEGEISLKSIALKNLNNVLKLTIDGKDIAFRFKSGIIYFDKINITECVEIQYEKYQNNN